jgi:hypothetical protein
MVGGDLDENDRYAVRVLNPHLDQSPRLGPRFSYHPGACRREPLMLGVDVSDLQPEHDGLSGRAGTYAGYLQEARAEKEHDARIVCGTKLPVYCQAEHVTIEATALIRIARP